VELINDFKAIGIALPALADREKRSLTPQLQARKHGVIACLGPGTGLGECFLTWNPSTNVYDVWPTEGGHSDFAPHNGGDMALVEHIRRSEKLSRVDVECVLSGPGLRRIYQYLTTLPENANLRHPEVEAKFAAADPSHAAAVVSEAAKHGDVLAKKVIRSLVVTSWHTAIVSFMKRSLSCNVMQS
jgi:glucokinase